MDFDQDSFLQKHWTHVVVIVGVVATALIVSIFTGIFEKMGLSFVLGAVSFVAVTVLIAMAIMVAQELRNVSAVMSENSVKLDKIMTTLEKSRAGLAQINHSTHLSEAAKAIAFRDANRQALREAVFEKLQERDFSGALEIIDEIGACGDFPNLAAQLRAQCESYRTATDQERVTHMIGHIEKLIENLQWAKASAQIEQLIRDNPDSEKARQMRQVLVGKKQERKAVLLRAWDDAVKRQDTDRSLEILRELDGYLTPKEALALQEAASDVFRTKLHNLGVEFSLALSEHRWRHACGVGQQIVRSFPNSRMASEIKDGLPALDQRAREHETMQGQEM